MPVNRFSDTVIGDRDEALYALAAPTNKLFRLPLTDDGSDRTLNENYSAATDAYVAFTRPAVIQRLEIVIIDGDVAQSAVQSGELFVGNNTALTNGLKFLVEDSAGTSKLDISNTYPVTTYADLLSFCTSVVLVTDTASATTANNSITFEGTVEFDRLYGRAISVNLGDRFVCVLQDNFSTAANYVRFEMFVSGFYL
jgi:hypothetical protein